MLHHFCRPRLCQVSTTSVSVIPNTCVSYVMLGPVNAVPSTRQDARTPDWALPGVQEFVPGRLDPSALVSYNQSQLPQNGTVRIWYRSLLTCVQQTPDINEHRTPFESFSNNHHHQPTTYFDPSLNGATFFQTPTTFQQPVSACYY